MRKLRITVLLISFLSVCFYVLGTAKDTNGRIVNIKAHNFSLKDLSGKEVSLNDYKGSNILLMFGYTQCSTSCPINILKFVDIEKRKLKETKLVYISIDPVRDSGNEIRSYINDVNLKNVDILNGETAQIKSVAKEFFDPIYLNYNQVQENKSSYVIPHIGYVYYIDSKGMLKLVYKSEDFNFENLYSDLKKI